MWYIGVTIYFFNNKLQKKFIQKKIHMKKCEKRLKMIHSPFVK